MRPWQLVTMVAEKIEYTLGLEIQMSLVSGSLEAVRHFVIGSKHEAWYRWRAKGTGIGSVQVKHKIEVVRRFNVQTTDWGTQTVVVIEESAWGDQYSGNYKQHFAPALGMPLEFWRKIRGQGDSHCKLVRASLG